MVKVPRGLVIDPPTAFIFISAYFLNCNEGNTIGENKMILYEAFIPLNNFLITIPFSNSINYTYLFTKISHKLLSENYNLYSIYFFFSILLEVIVKIFLSKKKKIHNFKKINCLVMIMCVFK